MHQRTFCVIVEPSTLIRGYFAAILKSVPRGHLTGPVTPSFISTPHNSRL